MQVGVLVLQDLEQPVLQLDIRIAAQLAEHGCALDRFVPKRIELAEQSGAADFRHECLSSILIDRELRLGWGPHSSVWSIRHRLAQTTLLGREDQILARYALARRAEPCGVTDR